MSLTAVSLSSTALMALLLMQGGDIGGAPSLLQNLIDAGTAGILLWIWWKTFSAGKEESKDAREQSRQLHRDSVEESRRQAQLLHEEGMQTREQTQELLKELIETQQTLAGAILRVEQSVQSQSARRQSRPDDH